MEKKTIFKKWKTGLGKTRTSLLSRLFGAKEGVNEAFYEELEEALVLADVGAATTEKLLDALQAQIKEKGVTTRDAARELLVSIVADTVRCDQPFRADEGAAALLIVGVNGVGKTTTVGKLAHIYSENGRKVMLAAADTFRAAAAEQLGEWALRANVPMVRHQEGADPAAVVFDAVASCKAKKFDLLICDTAGRLHNKTNLMNELGKIRRVLLRELPDTPCETLLVLDAVTGQNALMQARAFKEVCDLDGVILTKLDGTAKGGVVVAIADALHLPIRFVGVGEGIDDLQPFDAELFARAMLIDD